MEMETSTPTLQKASSCTEAAAVNGNGSGIPARNASGGDDGNNRTDQNEKHSLHLKKEYVLASRAVSLPPLLPLASAYGGDTAEASSKNNKNQKNNRKRSRTERVKDSQKACLAIVRGESCPFGSSCRYEHDLKKMLADRLEDIRGVGLSRNTLNPDHDLNNDTQSQPSPFDATNFQVVPCPIFEKFGYCKYGVTCRFGSSHLDQSSDFNTINPVASPPISLDSSTSNGEDCQLKPEVEVSNILSKELQQKLRKRAFEFQTLRYDSKRKSLPEEGNTGPPDGGGDQGCSTYAAPAESTTTTSAAPSCIPYPSKTRKIVDFRNKVYVAPLTTVGNLPFRRVMKEFGADITCGEMAMASNLLSGQSSEWALLKRHTSEDVFGVQIAAGYPDAYTRVAEVLSHPETNFHVDFVDLNLGCPLDMVCDKGAMIDDSMGCSAHLRFQINSYIRAAVVNSCASGAGASLMMRDRRLKDSVAGLTGVLQCPVTIKMRTGWDMNKPFAHELVPKIQSWNYAADQVGAVMIHGRSRLQRYTKEADWSYIARVAASQTESYPKLPVIGNGDIFSYTDYQHGLQISRDHTNGDEDKMILPCAMLARGALIKPWLPTEIKESRHWDISASERLDILKNFVRYGLEHWGSDQQGVNNCRRFLLEWLSFLHRYVPVGILEAQYLPQRMNQRPPLYMCGRNDLETLFLSDESADWIKISEMLLGPVPDGFRFEAKHKSSGYGKIARDVEG
jgi:tRNA-dihydrouridine synthase 3